MAPAEGIGSRRRHNGVSVALLSCITLGVTIPASACSGHSAPATTNTSTAAPRHVALDGAVYGSPLIIGNTVYAATEDDSVYALSLADGHILWRKNLGTPEPKSSLPCGDIDPLGITGAPAYDPATGRLFVVAETDGAHHVLVALNVADGTESLRVPVDPPLGDAASHLQRPALTFANGRVFAAFGGQFGDCGKYTGSVAAVDTTSRNVSWFTSSSDGRGGIWAPGPAAVYDGKVYYSVGNGNSADAQSPWDGTDAVVALTPDAQRADAFTPSTWAADNASDLDLGSMNPALVGNHIVIAGKAGTGYVLNAAHLGGTGGQLTTFGHDGACRAFGAAAVSNDVAYLPCADGTEAVRIAPNGTPTVLWHAKVTANGPPTLSSTELWATDFNAGTLYALSPATGTVIRRIPTDPLPHFASPAVAGTHLVLGTLTGLDFFVI